MRVSVDLNRKCYPWTSTQQHTTYAHACQQVYLEGQQLELWRDELLRELKVFMIMRIKRPSD